MLTSTNTFFEATGDGTEVSWTFPYPIHRAADLQVVADGAIRTTSDSTYAHTITVAANKQSGTIVFTTAPLNLIALKFERVVDYKQETDLANNSLFDAESLETSLDNIVMQIQQVGAEIAGRGFTFDSTLASTEFNTTAEVASTLNELKADRASKALAFDVNGDITISADEIDKTTDYQLEAKDWASKASGNVFTYTDGVPDVDSGETSAKYQAGLAATAKTDAEAAQALAEAALDSFDDRYLGAWTTVYRETTHTGLDNDGNALLDGALYFDTTLNVMKVWNIGTTTWDHVKPTAAEQVIINAVNADSVDIGKVAAKDTEIGQLAVLGTAGVDISTVAAIGTAGADVTTVANITAGDVSKVAVITTGDVSKVAAITTGDVSKVAAITTGDVSKVAVITTGDVSKVAAITTGDVSKVAVITTGDVSKVADVDGEVADVAAIDTEITTIVTGTDGTAGTGGTNTNLVLINSVHGKIAEVGNLGTTTVVGYMTALNGTNVIAHMAALNASGVIADIGDVADVDAEVTLLGTPAMATAGTGHLAVLGIAGVVTNIGTVAGISGSVTTVAGDTLDIQEIGDNIANINACGANVTYTEDMGSIADAASTGSTSDITTVAASIDDVNRYANEYTIDSSAPGSPDPGDLWYDEGANSLKVWNGSAFAAISYATEVLSDTTPQLGGNLDVLDKVVTTSTANGHVAFDKGITEKKGTATVAGQTVTVDLSTGNFFEWDLESLTGDATTFTISNADATSNQISNFIVKVTQGTSTTTRNFTWATIVSNGTNIDWAGGAGPDMTTGNDKIDILSFTTYDNGTIWYGAIAGQEFG